MKANFKIIRVILIIVIVNFTVIINSSICSNADEKIQNKINKELIGIWLGNFVNIQSNKSYEVELKIIKKSKSQIEADLSITDFINASKHYLEIKIDNENYIFKDIAFETECGNPEPGSILVRLLPELTLRLISNNQKLIGNGLISNEKYSLVLSKKFDKVNKLDKLTITKSTKINNKDTIKSANLVPNSNPNRLSRPVSNKTQPVSNHNKEIAKKIGKFIFDTLIGMPDNSRAVAYQNSIDRLNYYAKLDDLREKQLLESRQSATKNNLVNYPQLFNNGLTDHPNNYSYRSFPLSNSEDTVKKRAGNDESPFPRENQPSENNSNCSYKYENGILKSAVEHNITLPPVPDYLKAGVKFDESIIKSKKLTRLWYRIPNWQAGSWISKSQKIISSSNIFLNNCERIAEQEGHYGYEVDKLNHIWNFIMLPAYMDINANNNEPLVVHSIVFYFKPLQLESRKFVTMSKVYQVYVRKSDNIIEQAVQHETIATAKYVNEKSYQIISSNKWFDGQGNPISIDTRESYSYLKKTFKVYSEMPLAKELHEDFINYLKNHSLYNLIP